MSINHTLTFSISSDTNSTPLTGSASETGNTETLINTQFPASSTNTDYPITFSHTTTQDIWLWSDKGMTILVNSTGSPILTIVLVPGEPYIWNKSSGVTNPLSADVTHFYCSCTPASKLKGKILT